VFTCDGSVHLFLWQNEHLIKIGNVRLLIVGEEKE